MKPSNPISPFLRYTLILVFLFATTSMIIPRRYDIQFPKQPGPEFDKRARKSYITLIDENKPDIVMLGDSTLLDGVDPELLSEQTGVNSMSFAVPGSASAFWYIVLKNNIVRAEYRPRAVVVVFRDTMLTAPGYRVHGGYFVKLDEFAGTNEPILLERAYLNLMNPVETWAEQYFPLYGARSKIKAGIDYRIRYILPGWLGCDVACTDSGMYDVFTSADLEPGQLRNAVAASESYLYTPTQLDFARQVDQSFLPEMIRLTKERGIQLVVVRIKHQLHGNRETASIRQYISELSTYLDQQGVIFLDYGHDPRLDAKYFKDILHLNPEGRIVFTKILAEGLNNTLK